MSPNRPSDLTVAYYDAHALEYARATLGVYMAPLYEPFLALIAPGGHILDVGCGSGRDVLAFRGRGFRVTAIDASGEIAHVAREWTGQAVAVLRVQDLSYENEFDGIWACASLLHVPSDEVDDVIERLTRALRPGGSCYMLFKLGEAEEVREGRLFHDYTEARLRLVIERHPLLALLRVWLTEDLRPVQRGRTWVNALARKAQKASAC
jgi:SAM-dependent methyltransferase